MDSDADQRACDVIRLRQSRFDELSLFCDMAAQPHASNFVLQTSLQEHQTNFEREDFTYLTIELSSGETAGHFILVFEPQNNAVEFGRICIDRKHRGIGQQAIGLMENYCRKQFKCESIWLDVFEDNPRGIHIYEKLGYQKFKQETFRERQLLFYRKTL